MVLETFPSSRVRVLGPCLWWNSPALAKHQPFLRPLCGSEEHFENRKLSLEQGRPAVRRTTITINLHPIILSFTDPTHLAQKTPLALSICLSTASLYTFLRSSPPPIWLCQPPHLPSFFPSFPLCPSIHTVSTPSVLSGWVVRMNGSTARQVHAVL